MGSPKRRSSAAPSITDEHAAVQNRRLLETSTDYHKPHRPLPVAILNRAGRLAGQFGLGGGLSVDRMIASARRKTGLTDFGDEWFLNPCRSWSGPSTKKRDSRPWATPCSGQGSYRPVDRLRAENLIGKHPEFLDLDLGRIILIAGLQRTATTTLHRLIAADPDMRELSAWEALNPLPSRGELHGDPGAASGWRCSRKRRWVFWRRTLPPFIPSVSMPPKRTFCCWTFRS